MYSKDIDVAYILKCFPRYCKIMYNGSLVYDKEEMATKINEYILVKKVFNFNINIINSENYIIKIFGE